MKVIQNQIKIRWDEFLFDTGICMAGMFFGVICCMIGKYMGGNESLWGSGVVTLLTFLFGMAALIFTGAFSVIFHFNLLVGMSCVRKDFVKGFTGILLMRFLIIYIWSGIVYLIEGHSDISWKIDLSVVFSPLMILIIPAGTSVIMFIGACILKFGNKIIWVFWMFWMAACILPSRIAVDYNKHTGSALDRLGQFAVRTADAFTPVTASALGIAIIILLSMVSTVMLLRQKVQY